MSKPEAAKAAPTALEIQAAEQAKIEEALHPAGHHGIFGSGVLTQTVTVGNPLSAEQKAAAPKGDK